MLPPTPPHQRTRSFDRPGSVARLIADRVAPVTAVERRATDIHAHFEIMRTTRLPRGEVKHLEQLITPALAMLPVEPAAEITLRSNLIRRAAIAEDVAVKLLDAETRLQQCARVERRLLVQSEKPAALMKVCGCV